MSRNSRQNTIRLLIKFKTCLNGKTRE